MLDQRQGNAAKMYTAVRATAQRTKDHGGGLGGTDTKRETPANPKHAQRREPPEGQPVMQLR